MVDGEEGRRWKGLPRGKTGIHAPLAVFQKYFDCVGKSTEFCRHTKESNQTLPYTKVSSPLKKRAPGSFDRP
jgi:hypothetical protein